MKLKLLITSVTVLLAYDVSADTDTLLKNYTIAPRIEPHGVAEIGYPQICMRVNMSGERIDMQGILDELSDKYQSQELVRQATTLAASGKLGHVWTLFFDADEKDAWRSWSFRNPSTPLGDALNRNNRYDSPERAFNYQYCVSAKNKNIETTYLESNPIRGLVNESREMATLLMPGINLPENTGVYTPITPCVWFAVRLFNMVTGSDIPYQQPINGDKLAKIMNDDSYKKLDTTVDTSVVAEALSKRVKYAFSMSPKQQFMYLHNRDYIIFEEGKRYNAGNIKENVFYNEDLGREYNKAKAVLFNGDVIIMVGYNGKISSYNMASKSFTFKDVQIGDVFPLADIDSKKIKSTMPIYQGMPYFNKSVRQHLVFTEDSEVYLAIPDNKVLRKIDFFENYAPHVKPYINRIVGTSISPNGTIFLYLTENKFIELDPLTMDFIKNEVDMKEHPVFGDYFKLQ